jgi:hypothetical protein
VDDSYSSVHAKAHARRCPSKSLSLSLPDVKTAFTLAAERVLPQTYHLCRLITALLKCSGSLYHTGDPRAYAQQCDDANIQVQTLLHSVTRPPLASIGILDHQSRCISLPTCVIESWEMDSMKMG